MKGSAGSPGDRGTESGADKRGVVSGRFWEVDVARGVAILMVVLYHLVYDLDNFGGYPFESTTGFWGAFADASAFAFVFLAGLSLSLSHIRAGGEGRVNFGRHLLRRGAKIFLYGMLITLVFWALDLGVVIFGILHLIGASIVLSYPFLKLRFANLVSGLLLVAVGIYLLSAYAAPPGLTGVLVAPFGIEPVNLSMPDYRPLLPWFGVVLLGLFFGNVVYAGREGTKGRATHKARPLAFLGRHTLFIYLVHQPLLIATLWALGIIELGF